jgi:hypothetical protein
MMSRLALLVPRPRVHLIGYAGIFAANSSWRRHIVPTSPQPHRSSCTHALAASDEPGVPPPSALPATDPSTRQILVAMTVAAAAIDPTSLSPTVGPAPDSYPVHAAPLPRERYLDWASLLRRTFSEDILTCNKCGGPRRIIAFIEEPAVVRKILDHLGLQTTGPPRAPPRPSPQADLFDLPDDSSNSPNLA